MSQVEPPDSRRTPARVLPQAEESRLGIADGKLTPEQKERLRKIQARVTEARRELDALIGDAYLRPRASIVPVHFLDLASATEKLRWAEKEWRELDREVAEASARAAEEAAADERLVEAARAERPGPA